MWKRALWYHRIIMYPAAFLLLSCELYLERHWDYWCRKLYFLKLGLFFIIQYYAYIFTKWQAFMPSAVMFCPYRKCLRSSITNNKTLLPFRVWWGSQSWPKHRTGDYSDYLLWWKLLGALLVTSYTLKH